MKEKQFDLLAREHFGLILKPKGFGVERSKYCAFYRQASNDIYHVIMPDISSDGTWFDIRVFATSPLIEPQFEELFPDGVGIPSDSFSLLHPKFGVGARQQKFRCKTEDGFVRNFNSEVVPALESKALPYLDGINNLKDLIPHIRRDFYLGAALWVIGEQEQARELLLAEKTRLSRIADESGRVSSLLSYIDNVLGIK